MVFAINVIETKNKTTHQFEMNQCVAVYMETTSKGRSIALIVLFGNFYHKYSTRMLQHIMYHQTHDQIKNHM